ncbi:FAD synthase-like isoform X1 [Colletes gigas]|uniref:FAD synthase-like isoform X1 n=1 Tax=Colletes gigas TaxID=935657 RepID=UPI001C9B93F6|nr:FAD synthase-like isoform X1 [Colletes gigas]
MIHLCRHAACILSKYNGPSGVDAMLVRHKNSGEHPTAGIIVVGDEIVKAQVKDTNSSYACSLLYKYGVKVQKISVIRDDIENIAKEIKDFSQKFNYVFTTGGIGPTHDDVTYEAVALAFHDTLHYHPTLMDIVKNRFGCKNFPSPSYKMAYVPTKSVLKFGINETTGQAFPYPCIVMENVFVFPGSPRFFESNFQALCKEFFAGYRGFTTTEVYVNANEESFANILTAVVRECPNVSFGSYPEHSRYYKARVTIESENEKDVEVAKKMFCERVPSDVLVNYDRAPHTDCLAKYEKLLQQPRTRAIYKSSFEKFVNYYQNPDEVWIYLDGSEESVIMVHLARVAHNKLRQSSKSKLHAFYFKFDHLEPVVNEFFRDISYKYDVELCSLRCDEIDVRRLIASRSELKMLLLGKRSNVNENEIYENLTRVSNNAPVQINCPLIDWTDDDVASFVASLSLPYYATGETQLAR